MDDAAIQVLLEKAIALGLNDVLESGAEESLPSADTSIQVINGQIVSNNTNTTRKKRGGGKRSSRKGQEKQYLKYLIVVDFEATCWAQRRASPHEIIEFPAVLYNLTKQTVEDEFHTYVRPTERPKLSTFCTELTGIQQETVDVGLNIKNALHQFQKWLVEVLQTRKLVLPKFSKDNINGNVAFVTWGDWDFGACLKQELWRKGIKKPVYFNHWIDLRSIYTKRYNYRPRNFTDALNHLNMEFEGRAHSGIDDARNLAFLCGRLATDGHLITITTDLLPNKFIYKLFYEAG